MEENVHDCTYFALIGILLNITLAILSTTTSKLILILSNNDLESSWLAEMYSLSYILTYLFLKTSVIIFFFLFLYLSFYFIFFKRKRIGNLKFFFGFILINLLVIISFYFFNFYCYKLFMIKFYDVMKFSKEKNMFIFKVYLLIKDF